jgi:hypothetical protein
MRRDSALEVVTFDFEVIVDFPGGTGGGLVSIRRGSSLEVERWEVVEDFPGGGLVSMSRGSLLEELSFEMVDETFAGPLAAKNDDVDELENKAASAGA